MSKTCKTQTIVLYLYQQQTITQKQTTMSNNTYTTRANETMLINANKSFLWDCLNEDYESLPPNCTKEDVQTEARRIYKAKGYSSLPFLEMQEVFKSYFGE